MHKVVDTLKGVGAILLLLGAVAFWMGIQIDDGITPDSEDWSGTLMWEGTTPATFEGEFGASSTYNVWAKKRFDVSVEVLNHSKNGYELLKFVSCEEWDECGIYDEEGVIPGYEYIGEIYLEDMWDAGTYEVQFTDENGGEAAVMIREDGDGGFLVLMGGLFGCFIGILLLAVGAILSVFTKENKSAYIEPIIPESIDRPPVNAGEDQEKAVETPDKPWWQDDKIE